MAKILKFPTGEEIKQNQFDTDELLSQLCVDHAQFLMDVMEEFIVSGQSTDFDPFMQMNFRDETYPESRDMFVIVNLLNAMFMRQVGMKHRLQKTMDRTYIDIKAMLKQNAKARKELEDLKDDID